MLALRLHGYIPQCTPDFFSSHMAFWASMQTSISNVKARLGSKANSKLRFKELGERENCKPHHS